MYGLLGATMITLDQLMEVTTWEAALNELLCQPRALRNTEVDILDSGFQVLAIHA
jgi:hypothetical protein